MYYLLPSLSGILIAVMLVFNGQLTSGYGAYSSNMFIHMTGFVLINLIFLIRKEKIYFKKLPLYLYSGGTLGVIITVFNNLSFGRINVSAILALSLFGESITSLLVDQFGLLKMKKHPLNKGKLIGIVMTLFGIVFMTREFDMLAVVLSFLSGSTLVVSRIFNARLADETSIRISTFYNYFVGLVVAIPLALLVGSNEAFMIQPFIFPNPLAYLGGILGVGIVLISNSIVTKVPAFHLTLFLFVSQIFSGIILDIIISGQISIYNLVGGVFVTLGLFINLKLDSQKHQPLDDNT